MTQTHNNLDSHLTDAEFHKRHQFGGTTPLETALLARFSNVFDAEDLLERAAEQFGEVFGEMEEVITDAENEIDEILDRHADDISDEVAELLHDRAMTLGEANETQRTIYEKIEGIG